MKKLLLVFMLIFIPKVQALSYTDYSDYSEFTEKEIQKTDLIDVKTEKRYKYYKLEKTYGNYGDKEYDYVDYNDYILSDESEIFLTKPDDTDKIIYEKYGYQYKRVSPVNYIKINNLGSELSIKKLKVYDGSKQIIEFDTRSYKATDNILIDGSVLIKQNGFATIYFHERHYLDNLKIEMSLTGENINYKYEAGENRAYVSSEMGYGKDENYNHTFAFKYAYLEKPNYEYFYDLKRPTTNVLMKNSDLLTFYTYKDKIYRPYNLNKIYNDYYSTNSVGDFTYKDENDYKIYYTYRTRDIIKDFKNDMAKISNISKNDIVKVPNTSKNDLSYLIYFIIFTILSVFFLVLSKQYKKYKNRVKV